VSSEKKYRTIIFYRDYFEKFFVKQTDKVKEKIIWTLELIEEIDRVPESYLKHIESTPGLYEIRVKFGRDIFKNTVPPDQPIYSYRFYFQEIKITLISPSDVAVRAGLYVTRCSVKPVEGFPMNAIYLEYIKR